MNTHLPAKANRSTGQAALRAWARGAVQQSVAAKRLGLPEVAEAFLLVARRSIDALFDVCAICSHSHEPGSECCTLCGHRTRRAMLP